MWKQWISVYSEEQTNGGDILCFALQAWVLVLYEYLLVAISNAPVGSWHCPSVDAKRSQYLVILILKHKGVIWSNNSQDMPETQTSPSANQEGPNPHFSAVVARMMTAMSSHEYYLKKLQQLSPEFQKKQWLDITNTIKHMNQCSNAAKATSSSCMIECDAPPASKGRILNGTQSSAFAWTSFAAAIICKTPKLPHGHILTKPSPKPSYS